MNLGNNATNGRGEGRGGGGGGGGGEEGCINAAYAETAPMY